ncbi:P1 family peptidase [Leucobacter soli]|uniref:Beta-peptidyl aminopeptidase BapA n=1 Tax=Leucobacter soli TaxID=2812850 RepID=A0A916NH61_9MICO|nr:P1 family peptidase [Leucobacter soli]CAG7607670.1 Beta-peptidyl aminopeptidase BapA [Leucobacter soli]
MARSEAGEIYGAPSGRKARDLGLAMGALPNGPFNAITDVAGVRVGHTTLISGEGELVPGEGPVRTGVTVIVPRDEPWRHPLYAAPHRLNGNGEMTGLEWVRESGLLTSCIGLTNTHSVGVVRDALVAHEVASRPAGEEYWSLPVVGETWDGVLNDLNGFHVRPEHVHRAIEQARGGHVPEGSVGSGTGMVCHGFKGGIGTASRVVPAKDGGYTVGVLVQANHGRRRRLTIEGRLVGPAIELPGDAERAAGADGEAPDARFGGALPEGSGSIIVIVATDAPLLPHQCARLAQRATLGIARLGGAGENGSGDLAFCFSTGSGEIPVGSGAGIGPLAYPVTALGNDRIDPLFYAAIEATEEAIVNAMLASDTMTGINGTTRYGLPHDQLRRLLGVDGRAVP